MINSCQEIISERNFFIQDDEEGKPAYIKYDSGQFEIKNNKERNISFLKIDDCIYTSKDDTRCDCAVFDDKIFCFIELKTCKVNNQSANRKKADNQLKKTIINLKSENVVKDKELEAYACLTCEIDNKLTRITNAYSQDTIYEFEEELDTYLQYECKKEFN